MLTFACPSNEPGGARLFQAVPRTPRRELMPLAQRHWLEPGRAIIAGKAAVEVRFDLVAGVYVPRYVITTARTFHETGARIWTNLNFAGAGYFIIRGVEFSPFGRPARMLVCVLSDQQFLQAYSANIGTVSSKP